MGNGVCVPMGVEPPKRQSVCGLGLENSGQLEEIEGRMGELCRMILGDDEPHGTAEPREVKCLLDDMMKQSILIGSIHRKLDLLLEQMQL